MRGNFDQKRLLLLRFEHARDVGAAQRAQRFARHHSLLVRRHDEHRHLRIIGRDAADFVEAARLAIALFVERDAHALQSLERERAHDRAALADAAGENHRIEPAHRCDISADIFAHAIAISLEREQCAAVPLIGRLENFAHVARNAGETKQAALLVQHFIDLRSRQVLCALEEK